MLSESPDRPGLANASSAAMADCGILRHTHNPGVAVTFSELVNFPVPPCESASNYRRLERADHATVLVTACP